MSAGDAWEQFFHDAKPAPEYQGLSQADACELAERRSVEVVRVISVDDGPRSLGVTLDLRPDRLNLVVQGGSVIRAAYC